MGLIGIIRNLLGLGQAVRETAEVFRPNAEAADARGAAVQMAAMRLAAREFGGPSWWDRFIDGVSRLPRPLLAFGTIGLFVYAMVEPVGFAERMQGLALVPEPLWQLLFAIVAFYFGARELAHWRAGTAAKEAARIAQTAPGVVKAVETIRRLRADSPGAAAVEDEKVIRETVPATVARNPALEEWRRLEAERGGR